MTTHILVGFHHTEENSRVYGKRRTQDGLRLLFEEALEKGCDIMSIRIVGEKKE